MAPPTIANFTSLLMRTSLPGADPSETPDQLAARRGRVGPGGWVRGAEAGDREAGDRDTVAEHKCGGEIKTEIAGDDNDRELEGDERSGWRLCSSVQFVSPLWLEGILGLLRRRHDQLVLNFQGVVVDV